MAYRSLRAVSSEIGRLQSALSGIGLVLDRNLTIQEVIGRNRVRLTWPNSLTLTDFEFGTVNSYLQSLNSRQYSVLLLDGAIIQISYDFERNHLIGHRLVYFPCPVHYDINEFQELGLGITEFIQEILNANDFQNMKLHAPIRFDYNENARQESKSHVHISQNDCRIPVFAPLCLGDFIKFIIKNFYPLIWNEQPIIHNWHIENHNRNLTDANNVELHIDKSLL